MNPGLSKANPTVNHYQNTPVQGGGTNVLAILVVAGLAVTGYFLLKEKNKK